MVAVAGARFDNELDVGLREKELSRPWFQLAGAGDREVWIWVPLNNGEVDLRER